MHRFSALFLALGMTACGGDDEGNGPGSGGGGGGGGGGGDSASWSATYSGFVNGSVSGDFIILTSVGGRGISFQGSVLDGNPFGEEDGPRMRMIRVGDREEGFVDTSRFDYAREGIEDCTDGATVPGDSPHYTLSQDDDSGVAGEFDITFLCGSDDQTLQVTGSFQTTDTF